MKTLEESVMATLNGSDPAIFPYLPYILQDVWALGTSPEIVIDLVKTHLSDHENLRVLDLGCGKGAVSVRLAAELRCRVLGIDGLEPFIQAAKKMAVEHGVGALCAFGTGDIRSRVTTLSGFDVVILGAIGPVFGDYRATLAAVSPCLTSKGLVVIDDGYIDDASTFTHPLFLKKGEMMKQISGAGMELVEMISISRDAMKDADDPILPRLKKRCFELMLKHPDKTSLFEDYMRQQEYQNEVLETIIVGFTMALRKKSW